MSWPPSASTLTTRRCRCSTPASRAPGDYGSMFATIARSPAERRRVRQERSKPLVEALGLWLREQYGKVSPTGKPGKAIAYSLNAWEALVRFLDDGRLCMSNNAAERAMRPLATGRRNWTFAGSDEGGRRAAAIYTLIETAKLNDVDPLAWFADVFPRLQAHPAT